MFRDVPAVGRACLPWKGVPCGCREMLRGADRGRDEQDQSGWGHGPWEPSRRSWGLLEEVLGGLGFTRHGGELGEGLRTCAGVQGTGWKWEWRMRLGAGWGGCQGSSEARLTDVMESHGQKQSMKTGSLTCIS